MNAQQYFETFNKVIFYNLWEFIFSEKQIQILKTYKFDGAFHSFVITKIEVSGPGADAECDVRGHVPPTNFFFL